MREGALLKTLGARRGQIIAVLFAEYLALGTMATAVGLALSMAASALLVSLVFESTYRVYWAPALSIWAAVAALTVIVGLVGSRGLLKGPPLPALRNASE